MELPHIISTNLCGLILKATTLLHTPCLFLALTITSFYNARNERWAVSGVLGMLATMTRITGILLLPALLIEYLHQKNFKKEEIRKDVIWIFVVGLCLLIYLGINYMTFGTPFKFFEVQKEHWGMHLYLPVTSFNKHGELSARATRATK